MSVRIVIDGREIRPPLEYSIERDMLEPADAFTMSLPLDAETVAMVPLDAPYQLLIGDTAIMTGWIDEAEETGDGTLMVRGLDKAGRLVSESVPGAGMRLGNTTVAGAVSRLIAPWFDAVEFSNASNRKLTRGPGRKARALDDRLARAALIEATVAGAGAPVIEPVGATIAELQAARRNLRREQSRLVALGLRLSPAQQRQIPRRIDAGQKRWEALMSILEPLRLLAWTRGDGKALVVAAPQYSQGPQYFFSEEFERSNVTSMGRRRSIGDRYSVIEVSGSGRPAGVRRAPFVPAFPGQKRPKYVSRGRVGVARDTTGDFQRQKRLFVVSEAMSQGEAQELAERTLGKGLVDSEQIRVTVPDHGQTRPGTSIKTLYAFDTVARVRRLVEAAPGDDKPAVLVDGDYMVTQVNMSSNRGQGETTQLTLSPTGAALT